MLDSPLHLTACAPAAAHSTWSQETAQVALLAHCDPRVHPMVRCRGIAPATGTAEAGARAYTHFAFSVVWDDPAAEGGVANAGGRLRVESPGCLSLELTDPPGWRSTRLPIRSRATCA